MGGQAIIMAKWRRKQQKQQVTPVAPDGATVAEVGPPVEPEPEGEVAPGQVWEGVVVPDRPVNILSLRPGAVLPALVIDGPFNDGTGHWSAGFVGERGTKIRVDLEMLKTGKLRSA